MRPLVLVVAMLTILAPAAPAAADPRIGLSLDGSNWASTLDAPLFDPSFRWVPGDQQVRTFYVRNQSDDPALLAVDVLGSDVDSLIETGDLTISARGGGSEWVDVSEPGTHRLVSWIGVDEGDSRAVDVAVDLDETSPNRSQLKRLDLDLRVTLRQDATGLPGDGDGGGLLPGTGGPVWWTILVASGLLTAGVLVLRRREEPTHG